MPPSADRSADRAFLEEAPIGIFAVNENGRLTDVNPAACEMVGYSREELLDSSIADLNPIRDDFEGLEEFFGLEDRGQTRTEASVVHKEGHEVDVILDTVLVDGRVIGYAREVVERDIFRDGPTVVFKWEDTEGWPVIYASENVENVFGYGPDEVESEGFVFADIVHDDDLDRVDQGMAEYTDDGSDLFNPEPYRIITADGDVRWVMEYTKSLQEAGDNDRLLGYLVDITERKEREQEVETYQQLFDHTNDSIVRIEEVDGEPIVRDVNAAFEETFGYERETLIGEPVDDYIVPEDREDEAERFNEQVMEEGHIQTEVTRMADDGLREFLMRSAYFEDDAGYIVYTDITERKEREREIQAQYDRLQALYANAQSAIAEYVFEGDRAIVVDVNNRFEEVFGYDRETIVGDPLDGYVAPPGKEHETSHVNEEIKRGTYRPREVKRQTSEGVRTFILRIASIDIDEKIRGYASYSDITERKEYERELASQRDYLEVLNQVVRHDIRNDLQLVLAYADTVSEYVEGENKEHIDRVLEAARDAIDITTTARDMTEVMLQSDVDRHSVEFRTVLESEIEEVRSNYDRAVVRLDGSVPTTEVLADDMLSSVFRNLLTNAILHNDKDLPEVTISVSEGEDSVLVSVADNGPGIPDDRKGDIFEQGEMGFDSEGSGLGLYLVDRLVDRYDADLRVEDNDPEGTVFVVELPIADGG